MLSTIPKQKKIYIEVKCGLKIIPALQREIDHSGLTNDQVVVTSFNQTVIREFSARFQGQKVYSVLYRANA